MQESTDDPETKAGGKPGQKLDDDEDRKNPAYIPRKGLFFEHDVRGHAQEEERYTPVDFIHSVEFGQPCVRCDTCIDNVVMSSEIKWQ